MSKKIILLINYIFFKEKRLYEKILLVSILLVIIVAGLVGLMEWNRASNRKEAMREFFIDLKAAKTKEQRKLALDKAAKTIIQNKHIVSLDFNKSKAGLVLVTPAEEAYCKLVDAGINYGMAIAEKLGGDRPEYFEIAVGWAEAWRDNNCNVVLGVYYD